MDKNGWDDPRKSKLWRYNQHYFDDLNAIEAHDRSNWHRELIERWITENPAGAGSGWEPYPTSLRIINWVKWHMSGGTLTEQALWSLAVQARWLERRLERHLLGNHLFANAKALIFAGLSFDGDEANRWVRIGRDILLKELSEQILSDGGHFELSPMYHALALEDVLDLINMCRAKLNPDNEVLIVALQDQVQLMLRWLAAMSHPDDRIAFFNDAAFGIAPTNLELRAYAQRLGFRAEGALDHCTVLDDTGYVRLSAGPAVMIADMAEVGPSYLPGHAHADTLSFELSLFGQRLIVNSGTSVYGTDAERQRQRGTAAHSTVVVRQENSSEVWAGFRVARRAHILDRQCCQQNAVQYCSASHDGYRQLARGMTHERAWRFHEQGLTVEDELMPADKAEAIFHTHPDVSVHQEDEKSGRMVMPEGQVVRWVSQATVQVVVGTWHPEFGADIPNSQLIVPLVDGRSKFEILWLN
ncbi:MAG: heparinase II/III family protein [Rhodobacterales bacterium]